MRHIYKDGTIKEKDYKEVIYKNKKWVIVNWFIQKEAFDVIMRAIKTVKMMTENPYQTDERCIELICADFMSTYSSTIGEDSSP